MVSSRQIFKLHTILPHVTFRRGFVGTSPVRLLSCCQKERPWSGVCSCAGLSRSSSSGCVWSRPVFAQITTGTVTGTVKDEQGLAVPGASVTLVSEARGTRMAPVDHECDRATSSSRTSLADTYTLEITLEGFRPVHRTGIIVSGGDRVTLGALPADGRFRVGDRDGHRRDAAHPEPERRTLVTRFRPRPCRRSRSTAAPTTRSRTSLPASSPARSTAFASTRTRCRSTASPRWTPATTATA